MARKRSKVFLALCFLIVTPVFSVDLAHLRDVDLDDTNENKENNNSNRNNNDNNNKNRNNNMKRTFGRGRPFTESEFEEKLKELIERNRPNRGGRDDSFDRDPDENGFGVFLKLLTQLADRSPEDLTGFDAVDVLSRVSKPGPRKVALDNTCMTTPAALLTFLAEVRQAMDYLRSEDLPHQDTPDDDSHHHHHHHHHHLEDDKNVQEGTQEDLPSTDEKGQDDVTAIDDVSRGDDVITNDDDVGDDGVAAQGDAPAAAAVQGEVSDNATASSSGKGSGGDDGHDDNRDKEDELEGIDMEDVFEKLSEKSLECVSAFLDEGDSKALCRQFSHQSARVFSAFISTGADCSDYLDDGHPHSSTQEEPHSKASFPGSRLNPVLLPHPQTFIVIDPGNLSRGHYRTVRSVSISSAHMEHHSPHHHETGTNGVYESRDGESSGYSQRTSMSATDNANSQPEHHSSVRSWSENHDAPPSENFHSSFSESSSNSVKHHDQKPFASFVKKSSSVTNGNPGFASNDRSKSVSALFGGNLQPKSHLSGSSVSSVLDDRHDEVSQSLQDNTGGVLRDRDGHQAGNYRSRFSDSRSRAVFSDHNGGHPTNQVHTWSNVVTGNSINNNKPTRVLQDSSGTWVGQKRGPFLRNDVHGPPVGNTNILEALSSPFPSVPSMLESHSSQSTPHQSGHTQSSHFRRVQNKFSTMTESRNGQPARVYNSRSDDMVEGTDNSLPRHFQKSFATVSQSPGDWHSRQDGRGSVFPQLNSGQSNFFGDNLEAVSGNRHTAFQNNNGLGSSDYWDSLMPGHSVSHDLASRGNGAHRRPHQNSQGSHFGGSDDFFKNMMAMTDGFFQAGYRRRRNDDGFRQDLDAAHQRALLNQLMRKPFQGWNRQDVRHAIRLAPDVIDDDFLEGFPEDFLKENLDLLGSVASRWRGNAKFQLGYRRRIAKENLADFNASAISNLGRGLLALSITELNRFNPQALLNAKIEDIFKDDDDEDEYDKDDDEDKYEDDERAVRRLALGRRMQEAGSGQPQSLGKLVRFLFDDFDFLHKANPEELYDSMSELSDLDLDGDDASSLFQRVSQSKSFPSPAQFTRATVQKVRGVLPGMGLSSLKNLPREVVQESLEDLKDLSFGESEARELLEDMSIKGSGLTPHRVQMLGRLALGLTTEDLQDMDDHLIPQVLGHVEHLPLSDPQKRIIASKALKAQRKQGTLRLLQLPRFTDTVSVLDIGDLSDDEVADTLNVTSRINWRPSQAATILSKVQNTLGGRGLRPGNLPAMGRLVQGLLPGELAAMLDRQEDVDDLANVLGNQHRYLTSAQIDKLVELIEDKDFKPENSQHVVTPDFVAQKGTFLSYLRPELWGQLEFEPKGLESLLSILAKLNTRKLPRGHLATVANRLLPIIPIDDDTSPSDADDLKIQQLGEFMLGLTPEQVGQLDASAVLNNLPTLGTLPFTRSQAKAVVGKVEEAEPEWKCRSTVLANLGPLLQFAPEKDLDDLCDSELASSVSILEKRMERRRERVEERREEGLWREDSQDPPGSLSALRSPRALDRPNDVTEDKAGLRRLTHRLLAAALAPLTTASGRTRRAAVGATPLTCSVLRVLKRDVVNVPVTQIISMEDSQFRDCLEVLGRVSDWGRDDLIALFDHFSQVYGAPSNWTNEIIRQAGVLLSPLPAAQFRELSLSGVDALNSVGRHGWLDMSQLQAGFSRWLEVRNITMGQITFGEFSAMSEFVCGLTVPQIKAMPIDVFTRSLDVIGRARSCDDKQRLAYAMRAKKAFGDVLLNWEPAMVRDAGQILGALTPPGIQQLTGEQIALIGPSTLTILPVSFIRAMTDNQLSQLSTNQVNALTVDHFRALSAQHRDILTGKATVPVADDTTGTHPPKDAAEDLRWSVTSLLAAIFVAFVVY